MTNPIQRSTLPQMPRNRRPATVVPVIKSSTVKDGPLSIGFVSFIMVCVALVGLIYQMYDLTTIYLEYATYTEIEIQEPENISMPAMTICTPNTSMIMNQTLQQDTARYPKSFVDLVTRGAALSLRDVQTVLTIKDIFDLTPEPTQVFMNWSIKFYA